MTVLERQPVLTVQPTRPFGRPAEVLAPLPDKFTDRRVSPADRIDRFWVQQEHASYGTVAPAEY